MAAADAISMLEQRIVARLRRFEPGSPKIKEAMLRIGFLLEAQIKLNIRRNKLIDTGRLINSIRFEFFSNREQAGITLGSYGVPYAAIHEFGGTIVPRNSKYLTIPMQPQFKGRSPRDVPDLFYVERGGRKFLVQRIKGEKPVFAYILRDSVTIKARPYMRPAVKSQATRIVEIIRDIVRGEQ